LKRSQVSVINKYNISVKKKSMRIKINFTKTNFVLVKKLNSLGIINSYNFNTKYKQITMFPSYFRNVPYISRVKAVSRGNKTFNITLKGIKILNSISGASTVIISSSKGVITSREALNMGLGGKIIIAAY
jgi:ribosomal protein S8